MELIDVYFRKLCTKYTGEGDLAHDDPIAVDFDLIDEWAWRCGVPIRSLLDEFAIRLAGEFSVDELSFELCDAVVNDLFGVCTHQRLGDFPPLFWEVYEAFDAGEFHRTPDQSDDPVANHTVPMIEEFLKKRERSSCRKM
jgi:hypothetical protein